MNAGKKRPFTEGELDFMKVLWEKGESTPEEIQDALAGKGRELTYGTIRNVLVVMIEKGYVSRKKRGKVYLYRPRIGESEAKKSMLQDLLDRAFEGSESHMVATLLNGREIRTEELHEIRRLIRDGKKENRE